MRAAWVQFQNFADRPGLRGRAPWVWQVAAGVASVALFIPFLVLALAAIGLVIVAGLIFAVLLTVLGFIDQLIQSLGGGSGSATPDDGRRNVRVISRDE